MDSKTRLRAAALFVVVVIFLRIDYTLTTELIRVQPLGLDFLPIWTGLRLALERPADLYDFAAVTDAQHWMLKAYPKIRPFVYPPSVAPILMPFAFLGFWPAYLLFTTLSGVLFLSAAWRISGRWLAIALLLTTPPVLLAAFTGQVTFLVGGLALWALILKDRPIAAGALLGIAAALKPQLLVLFPLALVLERRWRMVGSALTAGSLLCAASLLLVGVSGWLEWFAALPRFGQLILQDPGLLRNVVTPRGMLIGLGVSGPALLAGQAACALAGVGFVVWAFTRKASTAQQIVALVAGGLLISPYAMNYEFALLAPAVTAKAARIEDDDWLYGLLALMMLSLTLPRLGAIFVLVLFVLQPWRATGDPVAKPAT